MTPTPREFGCKVANWFTDYNDQFKNLYGLDIRLPHDYHALRELGVSTALGGVMGLGRGLIWPGYTETKDEQGNVISKKKRSPWLSAAGGALLGAGSSAISNYAGQTLSQYNPEIDKLLSGIKNQAISMLPVNTIRKYDSVDENTPLLKTISGLG